MQKELLVKHLGEESTEEIVKITKAYDNYVLKFKKKLNKLLEPINYEVKVGVAFSKKTNGD